MLFPQADKKVAAKKKKDDEDRASGKPVESAADAPADSQDKSFWSSLSSTPCFLPAVTDVDDDVQDYSNPPRNSAAPNAFVSEESSLRNRAFVSKPSNA